MVAHRSLFSGFLVLAAGAGIAATLVLRERPPELNAIRWPRPSAGTAESGRAAEFARAATGSVGAWEAAGTTGSVRPWAAVKASGTKTALPPGFQIMPAAFPEGAVAGTEVGGVLVARERSTGDPVAGMRLHWQAVALPASSSGREVEIARGQGLTDRDGFLPMRFRARVSGPRDPRSAWARTIELRVRGADDLGRAVAALRRIDVLAPGASPSALPDSGPIASFAMPSALRRGDRAVVGGVVYNAGPSARMVEAFLDARGVSVDGPLRRRVQLAPGERARLAWTVQASESGPAALSVTVPALSGGGRFGGRLDVDAGGRQVGQAWIGELASPASIAFTVPPLALAGGTELALNVASTPAFATIPAAASLLETDPTCDGLAASALASATLAAPPRAIVPAGALRIATQSADAAPGLAWPGNAGPADAWPAGAAIARMATATERLIRQQNSDGGWGWVPGQPSRLGTSALGLHALDAVLTSGAKAGLPSSLARAAERAREAAVAYLRALEPQDPEEAAHALWALGPNASPALRERVWERMSHLGALGLARATAGLAAAGDSRALSALARLDRRAHEEPGLVYWRHALTAGPGRPGRPHPADVEATALAIGARLGLDPDDTLAPAAIRWLLRARQGDAWASPRATALAVEALQVAARSPATRPSLRSVTFALDGRSPRLLDLSRGLASFRLDGQALAGSEHLVYLQPAAPAAPLRVPPSPETELLAPTFALSLRYRLPERQSAPDPGTGPLRLRREYLAVPISQLARAGGTPLQDMASPARASAFPAGERHRLESVLLVRLTLAASRDLEYVTVLDPLPAGVEPVPLPPRPSNHQTFGSAEVVLHIPVLPRGKHVFFHALRPRLAGSFEVPGPVAQAEDAPDTRYRGAATHLELVP